MALDKFINTTKKSTKKSSKKKKSTKRVKKTSNKKTNSAKLVEKMVKKPSVERVLQSKPKEELENPLIKQKTEKVLKYKFKPVGNLTKLENRILRFILGIRVVFPTHLSTIRNWFDEVKTEEEALKIVNSIIKKGVKLVKRENWNNWGDAYELENLKDKKAYWKETYVEKKVKN